MPALDHRPQIGGQPPQLAIVRRRRTWLEAMFDRTGELGSPRQAQRAEQSRQLVSLGPHRFPQLGIVGIGLERRHGPRNRGLALEQHWPRTRPDRGQGVAKLIVLGGIGHGW